MRTLLAVLLLLSLAGCDSSVPGLPIGPPSPQDIALQPSDLPSDLHRCTGSGDINNYLAMLKSQDQSAYQTTSKRWDELKASGAKAGAIVIYTDTAAGCGGELGVGTAGKTATSFVIQYGKDPDAVEAWQHGVLGFPTPASGQQTPGLTQGVATGLGTDAWVYNRSTDSRSVYVAYWNDKAYDILFLSAELTSDESHRAVAAINSRVR